MEGALHKAQDALDDFTGAKAAKPVVQVNLNYDPLDQMRTIIQEEVQLYKNENSSIVFEKYLDNDLKNLVQTATRDYELSTEQIAAALTKALRELESQE